MATETLEGKTDEKFLEERCGDCKTTLRIPRTIKESVTMERERQGIVRIHEGAYEGFYVAESGRFYCNKKCFDHSTED